MDDNNIIYYIVLGAIYFLSKIFGKKKQPKPPVDTDEWVAEESQNTAPSVSTSFDDIFKELTGQSQTEYTPEEVIKPLEPAPVLASDIIDYRKTNIEAIQPDELIDIPNHKPMQRTSPVYEREGQFKIEEETNETRDAVVSLLADHDGLRQAVILKEIFDRKY